MAKKFIFGWLFVPALALMMGACGETDDQEEEGGTGEIVADQGEVEFGIVQSSNTVTAKDFNMSDIDALVELSLKIEGMRLEYAKMMSNGWEGELFGGPGENTSGKKFFSYYTDILENKDVYSLALLRLERNGILTNPTVTRGLFSDFADWCYSLNAPNEVAFERMITILQENHVRGSDAAMKELFDEVEPARRGGETDARQWFINLYAGDYKSKSEKIHSDWLEAGHLAATGGSAVEKYLDTYQRLYVKDFGGNYMWKDAHEVTKEAAQKGGQFYVDCVDEVVGGYVGTMNDLNDVSEETIKLAKKIKEGKATTADLKRFTAQLGSKYVKDKLGDMIGEDPGGLETLAGEITDWATNHAVDHADEEIAKGMGVNLYEIQKTTPLDMAVTIIEDTKAGSLTLGFPDKDGNTHIVTKPGEKNITVITTNGERVTQKVPKQEPGKVVVESHPKETKATIKLSPERVEMLAKGGEAKVEILSNCTYCRYRYDKPLPDWIRVSRKGTTLTISVLGNNSEQPRSASFRAEVSIEGKVADASAIVTVTQEGFKQQEDRPKIEATPTELTFEADGGEQTVKVDAKTYMYYGGITDSDCEDWITIKNGEDVTLIVTAAANPTTEERTGTIYAFATNTTTPTAEDVELLPIKVTQKAGKEDQQDNYTLQHISVQIHLIPDVPEERAELSENIQMSEGDEGLTITKMGNGAEVRYEYDEEKEDDYYTSKSHYSISFTIDDLSKLKTKDAIISNLQYKMTLNEDATSPLAKINYSIVERRFATNTLPMASFSQASNVEKQWFDYSANWGLRNDDLTYTDFYYYALIDYKNYSDTYYESSSIRREYSWGSKCENHVTVYITLKDASKSRFTRAHGPSFEQLHPVPVN